MYLSLPFLVSTASLLSIAAPAAAAAKLHFGSRFDASTSQKPFRRPASLSPRNAIRMVAPGEAVDALALARGTTMLASTGLRILQDPEVSFVDLYHAGDDETRARQVVKASTEAGTSAVWAAKGGHGTVKVLDRIQDVLIPSLSQSPRWLIGQSDITALHALWARAGILSIHGPVGQDIHAFSPLARNNLLAILNSPVPVTQTFPGAVRYISSRAPKENESRGKTRGRLLGGNLSVLASLLGSGMLPSYRGAILLVEDSGESAQSIDKLLSTLLRSREFQGIKGLAIGQLLGSDSATYTALELLDRTLAPLGIPVITGLTIGHDKETALPVVLGAESEIDEEGFLRVFVPAGRI